MKKNLSALKEKYLKEGLSEKNFEYAINAVKTKTKRQYIFENLSSDVRKVDADLANRFLDEIIFEKKINLNFVILKFFSLSLLFLICSFILVSIGIDNRFSVITTIPSIIFFFKALGSVIKVAKIKLKKNRNEN